MTFNPPSEIQVTRRQIPSWKSIPNTEIQGYPLMVYHAAFDATSTQLKRRLELIGEVMPQWVYTMYSQTHFHSTTHEVLGVVAGAQSSALGVKTIPGVSSQRSNAVI
ncbi:RmlC-like cupin domain-containing protein [Penicillium hetheringtonii]|uniref:RmlC-like cupin domain-containing protein n=1 Tax=Penicillium hetheringtonii TaxID=911720 RepID=A0AAD6DE48_9EURO|nr:RmlC-like cupin domain-containing protein [Penicillium hetheringtonii]